MNSDKSNWAFNTQGTAPGSGETDLLSVALHELCMFSVYNVHESEVQTTLAWCLTGTNVFFGNVYNVPTLQATVFSSYHS
jgi:hypothetical protein